MNKLDLDCFLQVTLLLCMTHTFFISSHLVLVSKDFRGVPYGHASGAYLRSRPPFTVINIFKTWGAGFEDVDFIFYFPYLLSLGAQV